MLTCVNRDIASVSFKEGSQARACMNRFHSDQGTRGRVREAINEYLGFFDESNGNCVKVRHAGYSTMGI